MKRLSMFRALLGFGLVCGAPLTRSFAEQSTTPEAPRASFVSHDLYNPVTAEGPLFQSISADVTGIDFSNPLDPRHPMRFLYHSGTSCGGVAIGDVDGDGRPDIFLAGGPGPNRLYRQIGDFHFEDVTERAGVDGGELWAAGCAMADVDGDDDLDIYVCNHNAPNQLFINDGTGQFSDEASHFGVDFAVASIMAAFADYDRDGDVDFLLLTNRNHDPAGYPDKNEEAVVVKGRRIEILPDRARYWSLVVKPGKGNKRNFMFLPKSSPDRLVRNNGDGTFSDVSAESGISEPGDGLSATWWDYNGDQWPDLYVGNDFTFPDHLYRNNGDGTFTDVVKECLPHISWFSMGADAADLNNDGLIDFLTADMSSTTHFMEKTTMGAMGRKKEWLETAIPRQYMRNALYLNSGVDKLMEAAYLAGLADSDWTWSVKLADWDCDGLVDAYFTNGAARNSTDSDNEMQLAQIRGKHMWDFFRDKPPRAEQNLAKRNRGNLHFEDVSAAWGLDHVGMSYAAAYSDLDRDGDLDLVVANLDEPVSIYRNMSANRHAVLIRLQGRQSNRYGLGALVAIRIGKTRQVRELKACSGYAASDEPLVHFGVGNAERIDEMEIRWPSGLVQRLSDLPVDKLLTIFESGINETNADDSPPWFERATDFPLASHVEQSYDDYRRQPLLPYKLSQLGPGIAWGDVDGDGHGDFYVGGAAGASGRVYLSDGRGSFAEPVDRDVPYYLKPFYKDRMCEDMTPLLFDADGDADLDLFVVSGSVECEPGDKMLADRLYLNDGKGSFQRAPREALPDLRASGATAAAADFDRDGDLDLFVGGRVIPGQYPATPQSFLLRNHHGKFEDATEEAAHELASSGLVTSAVWSDANDDGWLDLLVAHEWGPVKYFENRQGQLVERTTEAGLGERIGWWNSIAAADIDNDGDIDYAVGNFGLNTKYHASPEKPALLYYGDFDGRGKRCLVEAEYEGETLYPIRGKSCSTEAMPFLSNKFSTFRDFAMADLVKVYSAPSLNKAEKFAATTLESGFLINDRTGRFQFRPFPRIAQIAPAFGLAFADVDADGWTDLYLAHNFFSPQAETGRMDGGLSLLLRGTGEGEFVPIWPNVSGLIVAGDAKGLISADIDRDGWRDFVVTVNDGPLQAFIYRGPKDFRPLTVRLHGPPSNIRAAGARVTLQQDGRPVQVAEVYCGSGYLSQPSSDVVFGMGPAAAPASLLIRWPDGTKSEVAEISHDQGVVVVAHPTSEEN